MPDNRNNPDDQEEIGRGNEEAIGADDSEDDDFEDDELDDDDLEDDDSESAE